MSRFCCRIFFSLLLSHFADAMSLSSFHSTINPSNTQGKPDSRNSQCQPARPSTPCIFARIKPAAGAPIAPARGTARNHRPLIRARYFFGNQHAR
ncbi:hypothetical protein D3C80_1503280 [compost metagenome]